MGIDLLDITFRVERIYGLRLDGKNLAPAIERTGDLTVGDLHAALLSAERHCLRCRYNLRGLQATGRCPECGTPFVALSADSLFVDLRHAVADALGVDEARIRPESRLMRDLGMQ